MLILQRNKDEIINIGDNIEVRVMGIKENAVQLSVSLPNDVIRGESFHIGEEIEIKLLKITDNIAHLGINAPRNIEVWRHEVWKAKREGYNKRQRLRNRFLIVPTPQYTYG